MGEAIDKDARKVSAQSFMSNKLEDLTRLNMTRSDGQIVVAQSKQYLPWFRINELRRMETEEHTRYPETGIRVANSIS